MKRFLLAGTLNLLLMWSATAQISSDRPGFAFAPSTVGKGVFQVEAGMPDVLVGTGGSTNAYLYTFPIALRLGVIDALELRLETTVLHIIRVGGEMDSDLGFDFAEAGAKLNVLSGDDGGFTLSVLPSVLFPTDGQGGSAIYTANGVAGYAFPNHLSLVGVAGFVAGESQFVGRFVGQLGYAFTEALSGYGEVAAFPDELETLVYAGAGLTFLLAPRAQLDVFFDRGFDTPTEWYFGAGISFRLR
jgi:hypothetical protein